MNELKATAMKCKGSTQSFWGKQPTQSNAIQEKTNESKTTAIDRDPSGDSVEDNSAENAVKASSSVNHQTVVQEELQ